MHLKEQAMQRQVGLWIDHREAIVVVIQDGAEETKRIESGVEKHVRFSGGNRPEDGSADDQRDRQFAAHLARYYDDVISIIAGAQSILIFGPGEAKGELEKRLAAKGLHKSVVVTETADKMTIPQIAAKVRQYFQNQDI
jgi:stalled ribosome rescue protein Dom34